MSSIDWRRAAFSRFVRSIPTSTGLAEVVVDVEGNKVEAYLKPLGNAAGPQVLACEWVGSQLAGWFGLSTLDFGIMQIEKDDEIPLGHGGFAKPGPAFVSKREPGDPWSGTERALSSLMNPEDVARLVVFDTWTLNMDRFPPSGKERNPNYDNVFLSDRDGIEGKRRLMAIDHTHCFTNGKEITSKIGTISRIKDLRIYGLFGQFKPFLTAGRIEEAVHKIDEVSSTLVEGVLSTVPSDWGVSKIGLVSLQNLIVDRARFLADGLYDMFAPYCRMHNGELFLDGGKSDGGK